MKKITRRQFAMSTSITGMGAMMLPVADVSLNLQSDKEKRGLKIALNAYSFNKPLMDKTMSIDDMLDYCSGKGIEGVDLTGYYFPGYPVVPSDEYIFHVKKKAFRLGIDIFGTGVRNDFTWADRSKIYVEKQLVKDWVIVAEKLGASQLRIFTGRQPLDGRVRDKVTADIASDILECAEFAKNHGIMLALQNHNDFLKTSSDVDQMMSMIKHEWTGLMLDIGSYHTPDPYSDIDATSKYAISWQLKEKIFINETQVDTDYRRVMEIVKKSGYRGYLPMETLGEGDSKIKVDSLLQRVRDTL